MSRPSALPLLRQCRALILAKGGVMYGNRLVHAARTIAHLRSAIGALIVAAFVASQSNHAIVAQEQWPFHFAHRSISDVHNFLGFADAWDLRGAESDDQLLNMFEAPAVVRNDPTARSLWLDYVRVNRGPATAGPQPGDADDDGLPDDWEIKFGLNPNSPNGDDGANGDPDQDTVTNLQEYLGGTDPTIPNRWILAEGASGMFQERLAVVNPGVDPAAFTINYLPEGGSPIIRAYSLGPLQRMTIQAHEIPGLQNVAFSAIVTTTAGGVVVERTLRWNAQTGEFYGSHTGKAQPHPRTAWYLAEGNASLFETYVLLVNPNPAPAQVTANYLLDDGTTVSEVYTVAAQSRRTVYANTVPGLLGRSFATTIVSTQPINVERAMYATTDGRFWSLGHASAAMEAPATRWFVPEGHTGLFFEMYLLLSNPGATPATVTVRYLKPGGAVVPVTYSMLPTSRLTIRVDEIPGLEESDVSADVSSSVPILVERAMYWPGPFGHQWYGAHTSAGLTNAGTRWVLAEGSWGGGTETYILLANPNPFPAAVTLSSLRVGAGPITITRIVPANARLTVSSVETFVPFGEEFGMLIDSNVPIAVERAMYTTGAGQFWATGTSETGTRIR